VHFFLFEQYEHASGWQLNVTKSHGLLNWLNTFITVLGCHIGNDVSVDWDGLICNFQDQLCLSKSRHLSFCGRALITNVLGLSLFWYQATVFDVPNLVIAKINKILFPFVLGKKNGWLVAKLPNLCLLAVRELWPCQGKLHPFVLSGFVDF
jgi:hypothetical protein